MTDSKNIYTNPSTLTSQQKETNKVSYWLEKLFNQEKDKNRKASDNKDEKQNSNSNQVKKVENDRRTIKDMVHNSNTILMSISSVFPFDFYPTTINVEATRVTIITRQL